MRTYQHFFGKLIDFWHRLPLAWYYLKTGTWHKEGSASSEDELRQLVSASERHGQIDHEIEGSMIGNVFDFADRVAREVMVPRQDMVCLFLDDTLAEKYGYCAQQPSYALSALHGGQGSGGGYAACARPAEA